MDRRIFVSSTFSDLADYRESVRNAIRQLDAIDVSMEYFGARDERPKDECVRLIKDDSDFFIGIYAHRYGFIPKDDEISITEAEYNEATSGGLPRLIYILDDFTPWIPALIDKGRAAEQLQALKDKLKANHICAFFSNKDELAAKVAADLGRYFSRRERVTKELALTQLEPNREARLIQQLRSTDKYKVKRSIQALAPSKNPWLVDALRHFILGMDEDLAEVSIMALREIKGHNSAEVIALGLNSSFWRIRSLAAFMLGEMALFGRKQDAETVIDTLIEALHNPAEVSRVLDEIVHGIGKIGGQKGYDALINVLKSDNIPPFLKTKALHAPGRFWKNPLRDRFINDALLIVQQWPIELCKGVGASSIFKYMRGPLKEAVAERLQDK